MGRGVAIQDPLHGTLELSKEEMRLVDTRPFQRLRGIKQLGFAELAFPGATHSRFLHSLGAMHMATRIFDQVMQTLPARPSPERLSLLRQATRLAVLFHDLGHPPLSHASERALPSVRALKMGMPHASEEENDRQATHEDMTLLLLQQGELADLFARLFSPRGITFSVLAALITGVRLETTRAFFEVEGQDLRPLLSQIVSSELDADRMDYLRRDAFYSGVSYGNFDHNWLCQNIIAVATESHGLVMGLRHRGVWAFENFLLARYHMFLAVYYHHTATCFDAMLQRFYAAKTYRLEVEVDAYLKLDDAHLMTALRSSDDPWARAIASRRPWRLVQEAHHFADTSDSHRRGLLREQDAAVDAALVASGIRYFRTRNRGVLSKYFPAESAAPPLLVVDSPRRKPRRIDEYTPLYRRFHQDTGVSRVFCEPAHLARAQALVQSVEADL